MATRQASRRSHLRVVHASKHKREGICAAHSVKSEQRDGALEYRQIVQASRMVPGAVAEGRHVCCDGHCSMLFKSRKASVQVQRKLLTGTLTRGAARRPVERMAPPAGANAAAGAMAAAHTAARSATVECIVRSILFRPLLDVTFPHGRNKSQNIF